MGLLQLQHETEARGFLTSVAPIELPEQVKERYRTWIAEGKQAGMEYLERLDDRLTPQTRLPWARSVLMLAAPHAYPDPGVPAGGIRLGKVARYAWVRDYHLAIQPHLSALEQFAARLGIKAKGYIDHGPLSERSYTALGGLGWIGKNTMLMRMGEGSYLTLAALITDQAVSSPLPLFSSLPLLSLPGTRNPQPGTLYPSRCGTCTRCLSACPTSALLADGTLDSRLCISYWTIEHRGLIPTHLWPSIGNWLFGCDICQEVCPWNRKAKAFWQGFEPEPELAHPDLTQLFDLSSKAFARLYTGTVFVRPGRTRMARNALIVLANQDDDTYLPLVRKAVSDVNPIVRATTAHALVRLGDQKMAEGLLADPEALVVGEAKAALDA